MAEKDNPDKKAYDKETNHSINKENQEEWLEKVSELLEKYKDYGDYK